MIQCAGKPSEKFCSRICCVQALKNALKLKELNPQAQIIVLYRDMRAYGFKERLYTEAREKGILFGSGLVGGGGLTGVLLAIWVVIRSGRPIAGFPPDLPEYALQILALITICAILGLMAWFIIRRHED